MYFAQLTIHLYTGLYLFLELKNITATSINCKLKVTADNPYLYCNKNTKQLGDMFKHVNQDKRVRRTA